MSDQIRAAVVGVGSMGRNHARILAHMPDVELVAVVDASSENASLVASQHGVKAYSSVAEMPDVDFAVVAVPTFAHAEVAVELLGQGTSLLVEKPLASTPEEAARIVEAAEAAGAVLAVGHIERFNPAISTLAGIVREPVLMQFERLSPYTARIRESIVFDLMVHDLDLACHFAGGYPAKVEASGSLVLSDTFDVASALLTFENGCITTLTASRITQDKVRRVQVSERERFITVDSLRQEIGVRRETQVSYSDDGVFTQAGVVEMPNVPRYAEPLALELRDVLDAIRERRRPTVDGAAGLAAVKLAWQVEQAAAASL